MHPSRNNRRTDLGTPPLGVRVPVSSRCIRAWTHVLATLSITWVYAVCQMGRQNGKPESCARSRQCSAKFLLGSEIRLSRLTLRPVSDCSDFSDCAKWIVRAATRNTIARAGCASLLQCSSHHETRHAAGSASLSRPAACRFSFCICGLHTPAFAESRRTLDRKGQRRGASVFTEASQLYLRGVHGSVSTARPGQNALGYRFG